MPLDPDHELFAAILDTGSIAAAARMLDTSPAMVSKRLARFEARLGARLIERTTRRLHPTPIGAQLHADLAPILSALAAAEARVTGAAAAPAGPLRIAAPTSFARLHVARRLADNRRVVCASPAYLAAHGMPTHPRALADHRLLAADGQLPWTLLRPGGRAQVTGRSHVRTNSSEIVRELALAGVGIALRSLWDVGRALADGRLVRILPAWEGPRDLAIHAIHGDDPRPAVTAFIDHLAARWSPPPWEALDSPATSDQVGIN